MVSPVWGARPAVVARRTTKSGVAAVWTSHGMEFVQPSKVTAGCRPHTVPIVFGPRWLRSQSLTFADSAAAKTPASAIVAVSARPRSQR
jgi:hypothetical protein